MHVCPAVIESSTHDHFAPSLVTRTSSAPASAPRKHDAGLIEVVNGDVSGVRPLRADLELELASGTSGEPMVETSSVERHAVTNGGTAPVRGRRIVTRQKPMGGERLATTMSIDGSVAQS